MHKVDLIVENAGQFVTCSSPAGAKRAAAMRDPGVIPNGAVAVANGRIEAVGDLYEIRSRYDADTVIDAGGRVVCPGFVDPHTHIVYAGDRLNEFELKIQGADYLTILTSGGGIVSTVRHTRSSSVESLADAAVRHLDKMLTAGTTTCEIKTGYGLDTETELKMLAAIEAAAQRHTLELVPTLLAAHAIPPEFKDNADAYVDLVCTEILPRAAAWRDRSQVFAASPFFIDVFCEQGAYTLDQTRRIFEAARRFDRLGLKVHSDQFNNLGATALAIEMGAVSVDHLDAISDDEVRMLAASNTVGVVIPTENFSGGKTQFADARKLIDSGCAVAISTDYNPGSAPCPSQPMAMAIACRYQKLLPVEAMNAATINAAHAIGLGATHGSLEPGKQADMLILEMDDYRQLSYEFGSNQVSTVIKSGLAV
jgi:imidazolonepropionase